MRGKKRLIFIVGPTAVGKTSVGIALARRLNAEIISCDSMQVYKGLDVLTSKPTPSQKKKVRHYLVGEKPLSAAFDARQYRSAALAAVKKIISKGKIPVFVGGTGLYMSVVVDGLFSAKGSKKVRQALEKAAQEKGPAPLYRALKKADPAAARKIHPNDARRIIRALEVFKATGKPISYWQGQRKGITSEYDVRIFCLDMERDALYRRIDARVASMFRKGAVREAEKALRMKVGRNAGVALGLRELKGYFEGEYTLAQAKALIQRNTRWYAKRQLTWFRKDPRTQWVRVHEGDTAAGIAQKIERMVAHGKDAAGNG